MAHRHASLPACTASRQPRQDAAALAGIGLCLFTARIAGVTEGLPGPGPRPSSAVVLSLADDALVTARLARGGGRVLGDHAVTVAGGDASASLAALAEVPRRGAAWVHQRLTLSIAVTNTGPGTLDAHLWLTWSGMMPSPIVPRGLAGDVAVAALVRDTRAGFARFLSSVSGPGVGDRKLGSTSPGEIREPGIHIAALPPRGLAGGGNSLDLSEGPLVLPGLASGESRLLTWHLAVGAEALAGMADPRHRQVPLARRGLALTGSARAT